jgi:hypothetical protein
MTAYLTAASLKDAKFTDAVYDLDTTWPEDFDPEAAGARLSEEDVEDPED